MNIKTIALGSLFAVMTSGLTILSMQMLRIDETTGKNVIAGLFSHEKVRHVEFVEVKNQIITLKTAEGGERYMLLELNLVTTDPAMTKTAESMIPVISSATVSLFMGMDYASVRAMSINDLHDKLKASYTEKFAGLKVDVPFEDVIISKMVFQ